MGKPSLYSNLLNSNHTNAVPVRHSNGPNMSDFLQEKMYESRLYHLENVLEEMRQREGHFMHLAEETAILKDQVIEHS